MGVLSPLIPTFEDFTGSIFTVNDIYQTTPPFTGTYVWPNGARNYPGRAFYTTYTPVGSSTPNWVKLRYVRYNPTAAITFTAGQLPAVFWKDNTFTTVTPTSSEGTLGLNGVCGILLNTTTTSANLTGNWTLICVAGYLTGMISVATVVAGSIVIGAAVAQTVGVALVGTAPPNRPLYIATTAISGGLSNGIVCCEDITP